jgi:Stress responsive A/B Barrel Domain
VIRHVVLVRFKPDTHTSAIFDALKALQAKMPGIIAITAGSNSSPEGLQRGNTHAFTVDFINAAARDAYLPHPEHQKVGAMIVAAAEGGVDGITVVDWEVD